MSYRAYKANDGSLKVHVYDKEKFEKEIELSDFLREFYYLKSATQ